MRVAALNDFHLRESRGSVIAVVARC